MSHIAGAYSATYNGLPVGQIEDGFDIDHGAVIEEITSDFFRAREDGVYQGIDLVVRFIATEPDQTGAAALQWPYDATLGDTGIPGRLMRTMAKQLVLTRCAGTSATPATITFQRAVLWTDRVVSKYGLTQRKLPFTIAVLPISDDSSAGVMKCSGGTLFTTA